MRLSSSSKRVRNVVMDTFSKSSTSDGQTCSDKRRFSASSISFLRASCITMNELNASDFMLSLPVAEVSEDLLVWEVDDPAWVSAYFSGRNKLIFTQRYDFSSFQVKPIDTINEFILTKSHN
mmetsp:Transcript_11068/g.16176  ORF Transcript_11068/g.16176 Transcript_11068/m.16176 type:complete len:122 (+) Transcript_11068:546-911(+)